MLRPETSSRGAEAQVEKGMEKKSEKYNTG